MNLYDVDAQIRAILDDTDDGELSPDAESRLAALEMDRVRMVDQVARCLSERQARAGAFEAESRRLGDLARAERAKEGRLRAYLKSALEAAGITRLTTELFALTICRNGTPSVRIAEGAEIPEEYRRVKVELNAAKVVEEYKAGWPLPPGIVCEISSHLRIR